MADAVKYAAKLRGKRILIVGGSSGIGFAVAEASIENGAEVIISSSRQSRIDEAIERILKSYPSAKGRVHGVPCDLGDAAALEQNVVGLLDKVGTVDHIGDPLVIKPLDEITVDMAFQSSLVRYFASLMIGKHATKHLTPGPFSSITLTTGGITDRPIHNWVLTGGIMCGVEGIMRGLALDLAPIRVNVISPGAVETELWNHMNKDEFLSFKKHVESDSPTGRLAQPEDLAEAYIYAMRDPNVTGVILRSNSGALLK